MATAEMIDVTTTAGTSDPWQMEVGAGGGEFVLIPAGTWTAILVGLFDVGTHTDTLKDGGEKDNRKLVLVYELVKKDANGKPYVVCQRLNWSMHEMSSFFGLACKLTKRMYAAGEKFNPKMLLGLPCVVQISHRTVTKNGQEKTYHDLGDILAWSAEDDEGNPKPQPKPSRQPVAWSVQEGRPLPRGIEWIPNVFGLSIGALVEQSKEFAAGKVVRQADANGDEIPF